MTEKDTNKKVNLHSATRIQINDVLISMLYYKQRDLGELEEQIEKELVNISDSLEHKMKIPFTEEIITSEAKELLSNINETEKLINYNWHSLNQIIENIKSLDKIKTDYEDYYTLNVNVAGWIANSIERTYENNGWVEKILRLSKTIYKFKLEGNDSDLKKIKLEILEKIMFLTISNKAYIMELLEKVLELKKEGVFFQLNKAEKKKEKENDKE